MTPFQHETAPKDEGNQHLDLIIAHQRTERRFGLGVLRTVFVVMALLGTSFLFPNETANVLAPARRYLFERKLLGNKDNDGNDNDNGNNQIGAECGPNKKCDDKSVCDGGLCRTCGKESEICCGFDSFFDSKRDFRGFANQREPTIGDCEGNLECDFNTELGRQNCRKCWESNLDRCGFDSTCCDKTTTCQDDECVPCGGEGQACCDNFRAPARCNGELECGRPDGGGFPFVCKSGCKKVNEFCDSENPCCGQDDNLLDCDFSSNTCVECGGDGQPDCDERSFDCDEGFDRVFRQGGFICEPCGGKDELCCDSDRTNSGASDLCNDPTLACNRNSNRCDTCAALEAECDEDTPCCSPFACNSNTGKCSECGGENQPCCEPADIDCDGRLVCDFSAGFCRPCGGLTEPTCEADFNGHKCDSDLFFDSKFGGPTVCETCAGELESCEDTPCCQGDRLRCGDDNVCIPCGGKDEIICPDFDFFVCDSGLFLRCDFSSKSSLQSQCTDDVFDACVFGD